MKDEAFGFVLHFYQLSVTILTLQLVLMTMDKITSGYLKIFKKEQSFFDDLKEPILFEHFINYCIVFKEYNKKCKK